jgi:hypothetical protein
MSKNFVLMNAMPVETKKLKTAKGMIKRGMDFMSFQFF